MNRRWFHLPPRPAPSPAHLPQVAFRGFLFSGVDPRALLTAQPFDALDLNQNARVLWAGAQALGLQDVLRAERAAQVRAQGGLLS